MCPYIALLPGYGVTESVATTESASLRQVHPGALARVYRFVVARESWNCVRRITRYRVASIDEFLLSVSAIIQKNIARRSWKKFIYNKYNLRNYRMTYISEISSATQQALIDSGRTVIRWEISFEDHSCATMTQKLIDFWLIYPSFPRVRYKNRMRSASSGFARYSLHARWTTNRSLLLSRRCSLAAGVRRGPRTFPGACASCCCSRARLSLRSVPSLIPIRTFQTPRNARIRSSSAVTADAYPIYGIATATEIARTASTRTPLSAVSCNFLQCMCKYCNT